MIDSSNKEYSSITNGDKIYFSNFFLYCISRKKTIFRNVLIALIFSVLIYFLKPVSYSVNLSFYTNYSESSSTNSLINTFIGQTGQSTGLDFSISDYIKSDNFLSSVVSSEYLLDDSKFTLVDRWGNDYNKIFYFNPLKTLKNIDNYFHTNRLLTNDQRKKYYTQNQLLISLIHSESRTSGLNTITLVTKEDSNLSNQIMKNIYNEILNYSSSIVNTKAKEKKAFISNELKNVHNDLKKSEEIRAKFLFENKNINNSPNLTLQKNRLDRDVALYEQLYFTLSEQLELAKIDEKDNTSSIFLLDSDHMSVSKYSLSLLQQSILLVFITILFTISFFLYKDRKNLFL